MTPTETVAEFLNRAANNGYENDPKEYGYEESCSRGAFHRVAEILYPLVSAKRRDISRRFVVL